jgi:F0F1-type ATP synthase membrane subunit c/vacuolar-type H+-ATPase subunit K
MNTPVNRILWWALSVSLLVYMVVAHVVPAQEGAGEIADLLFPVFALISLGVGGGTVYYRRIALANPIRSGALDPTTPEGRQRAFQPFIINLVLSESVGIYGLVLAFLSGNPMFAVGFGVFGLLLLYLHRPTAPDLQPPPSLHGRGEDPTPIG